MIVIFPRPIIGQCDHHHGWQCNACDRLDVWRGLVIRLAILVPVGFLVGAALLARWLE